MIKLFDKKFVHFMWDDELKGKKCFVSDTIEGLKRKVENAYEGKVVVRGTFDFPFQVNDLNKHTFRFAYYDPNYEVKKAYNEGKQIQVMLAGGVDWRNVKNEGNLERSIQEGRQFRVKPEDEWIAYLARLSTNDCESYCLTMCYAPLWKEMQKLNGAKTKLFVGTKDKVRHWCQTRDKFVSLIKAWEDGEVLQYYDRTDKDWSDVVYKPLWNPTDEYRIKPNGLVWTELKIGHIISDGKVTSLVTSIDTNSEPDAQGDVCHIYAGDYWLTDDDLKDYKVVGQLTRWEGVRK